MTYFRVLCPTFHFVPLINRNSENETHVLHPVISGLSPGYLFSSHWKLFSVWFHVTIRPELPCSGCMFAVRSRQSPFFASRDQRSCLFVAEGWWQAAWRLLVNTSNVSPEVLQLEILWLLFKPYVHCLNLGVWNVYGTGSELDQTACTSHWRVFTKVCPLCL